MKLIIWNLLSQASPEYWKMVEEEKSFKWILSNNNALILLSNLKRSHLNLINDNCSDLALQPSPSPWTSMAVTCGLRRDFRGASRWREAKPAVRRRGRPSPTIRLMFARGPLSSFWQFLSRSTDKMRRPNMQVTRLARATWCTMRNSSERVMTLEAKRVRKKSSGSTGNWTERPKFCFQFGSLWISLWMLQ